MDTRQLLEQASRRLREIARSLPNVADCEAPQADLNRLATAIDAHMSQPAEPSDEEAFVLRWSWYSDTAGNWQVVKAPQCSGGTAEGCTVTLYEGNHLSQPTCAGDSGECAFNGACMYACGKSKPEAEQGTADVVPLKMALEALSAARLRAEQAEAKLAALSQPDAPQAAAQPVANDLALLVMRMARRLSITEPGSVHVAGNQALARQATEYLSRKGLISPLREDAAIPPTGQAAAQPVVTVQRGGSDMFGRATVIVRWEAGESALPDGQHKLYATPPAGERSTPAEPLKGWKLLKDSTHVERSWPEDASHENGNYSNCCCECGRQFVGHKRRAVCKVCATPPSAQPGADQ